MAKATSVRLLSSKYLPADGQFGHTPQTAFADAWPLLILSEESVADLRERMATPLGETAVSLRNFRPNVVVAGGAPYEVGTLQAEHAPAA